MAGDIHPDSGDSSAQQAQRGERALIRDIRSILGPAYPRGVGVPFGDDMAPIGESERLWTCDMLMDGVDFDSSRHSWEQIGRKAMAVNLSDCAAMGVRPVGALIAVALENRLSMDEARSLAAGAAACAAEFACPITGGDTNSWNHPTVISITVAGEAPAGRRPVLRGGAKVGDRLYVSGPLGGSILGRHLSFTPRVELGLRISRELPVHAMIDISDGLAVDLWHICEESGCGAALQECELERVIHTDARRLAVQSGKTPLERALHDGEDFELVVALPRGFEPDADWKALLSPIGEITAERELRLQSGSQSRSIAPRGWEHFRG
ncbi:MAG: thiamine-monophosphate kinase [Planctomycetes bacterium]|nr:thiamine-monophosphate kinase [Planctomycetota bacterium]